MDDVISERINTILLCFPERFPTAAILSFLPHPSTDNPIWPVTTAAQCMNYSPLSQHSICGVSSLVISVRTNKHNSIDWRHASISNPREFKIIILSPLLLCRISFAWQNSTFSKMFSSWIPEPSTILSVTIVYRSLFNIPYCSTPFIHVMNTI